jgi:hypothetical protein
VKLYGCASHWQRGPRVCANGLVARVEVIDAEIVATLAEDVLRPTVIEQALALAFEDLAPAGSDRTRRRLEAELMKVTDECARLAEAVGAAGGSRPCSTGVLPELSAKLHQLVSSPGGFVNRWRPPFDGFSDLAA